MHKPDIRFGVAAIAAALLLTACSGSEQPAAPPPSNDAAMAVAAPTGAAPVVLPPALIASRTYRCKDNSLIYVDFFGDNISADLKTDKAGAVTKLTAPAAGDAFSGGGFTVSGTGTEVTITQPAKGAQSCRA
ncbi:MAG: hypothetical protein JWN59_788 [Sphingomonas bacterium]|jgi:hypothetical protein|nr:hypothetical protein [Sphingomonas bacterium]